MYEIRRTTNPRSESKTPQPHKDGKVHGTHEELTPALDQARELTVKAAKKGSPKTFMVFDSSDLKTPIRDTRSPEDDEGPPPSDDEAPAAQDEGGEGGEVEAKPARKVRMTLQLDEATAEALREQHAASGDERPFDAWLVAPRLGR